MYKVIKRSIYCETFVSWLKTNLWCHLIIKIYPNVIDLQSDSLVELYLEKPNEFFKQYKWMLLKVIEHRTKHKRCNCD